MRYRLILFILFIMVKIFSITVVGEEVGNLDIDTFIEESLYYTHKNNEYNNVLNLSFEIKKDFDYDKRLVFNPGFDLKYKALDDIEIFAELEEVYYDYYGEDIDIRIGKQKIFWGSGYKVNPTSKINPIDLTAEEPFESLLGVTGLKGTYYYNFNTSISGVIIGDFQPSPMPDELYLETKSEITDNIVKPNIFEIFLESLRNTNPSLTTEEAEKLAAQMTENSVKENLSFKKVTPEIKSFETAEYGIEFTRRDISGYDLSLSLFTGYEDLPSIKSEKQINDSIHKIITGSEAAIEFEYKRNNSIGLDIIGAINNIGVWSEMSYNVNEDKQETFEVVLGTDYTFKNNIYMVNQLYFSDAEDIKDDDFIYHLLYLTYPLKQIHELNTTVIYDLNKYEFLINPEVVFSLQNNLTLVGGTLLSSNFEKNNTLLSILGEEKSYLSIKYAF